MGFIATDGLHHATIGADELVSLQMIDVARYKKVSSDYVFLNHRFAASLCNW